MFEQSRVDRSAQTYASHAIIMPLTLKKAHSMKFAKAKGRLRGKPPKLSLTQETNLGGRPVENGLVDIM